MRNSWSPADPEEILNVYVVRPIRTSEPVSRALSSGVSAMSPSFRAYTEAGPPSRSDLTISPERSRMLTSAVA